MSAKTDWDKYYGAPVSALTRFTRSILTRHFTFLLQKYLKPQTHSHIIEFGGGNSVLLPVFERFHPKHYLVFDNCLKGIDLFDEKTKGVSWAKSELRDLTSDFDVFPASDLTVSVGLIEHFPVEQRKELIDRHFACTRDGGLVIITFPTPTLLYKICRKFLELFNHWHFHDETALSVNEVDSQLKSHGEILSVKILWLQLLTQAVVVIRKDEIR